MASSVFSPILPCAFTKHFNKLYPLKFISGTPQLGVAGAKEKKVSTDKKTTRATHRSRAGIKFSQINEKYNLVEPGHKVLDIGAAHGSWLEYLATETNSNGKGGGPKGMVIAIDLQNFKAVEGVHSLTNSNFMVESSQKKIAEILGRGNKFNFIFSDILHCESGIPFIDGKRMVRSVISVYLFMMKYLKQGGGCLVNVQGAQSNPTIMAEAKKLFKTVDFPIIKLSHTHKPYIYLLGNNFLGVKT